MSFVQRKKCRWIWEKSFKKIFSLASFRQMAIDLTWKFNKFLLKFNGNKIESCYFFIQSKCNRETFLLCHLKNVEKTAAATTTKKLFNLLNIKISIYRCFFDGRGIEIEMITLMIMIMMILFLAKANSITIITITHHTRRH